jgi:proteic killer suppression protein
LRYAIVQAASGLVAIRHVNRLHALERDRKGKHAICVNDQWRICFRFEDADAYEVEIADYH